MRLLTHIAAEYSHVIGYGCLLLCECRNLPAHTLGYGILLGGALISLMRVAGKSSDGFGLPE